MKFALRFLSASLLLFQLAVAQTRTPTRNAANEVVCPNSPELQPPLGPTLDLQYTPFKPWFAFYEGTSQDCWTLAICTLGVADEARKSQFGAVSLVMGLIPLTLKDVAWPERRVVYVTERLSAPLTVLVMALGLVPVETKDPAATKFKSGRSSSLARWVWLAKRSTIWMLMCASGVFLILSYGFIAVIEIYSKRSSLGCVYPIFVVTWYVIALIPAAIHRLFASFRLKRQAAESEEVKGQAASQSGGPLALTVPKYTGSALEVTKDSTSAIQGADEEWPVQLAWGVYYAAGTLVFSTIMAVTVIELLAWFVFAFIVTGSSKFLAFCICLVKEERADTVREKRPIE